MTTRPRSPSSPLGGSQLGGSQLRGAQLRGAARGTALVVESDAAARRALMRSLSQLDLCPVGFGDAGDALDWLEQNRAPVLVSVDLSLTVDGERLCQALRDHPRLVNVPFIGTAECHDVDVEADAGALGVDVVLPKPVPETDYLRAAARLCVPWRSPVSAAMAGRSDACAVSQASAS